MRKNCVPISDYWVNRYWDSSPRIRGGQNNVSTLVILKERQRLKNLNGLNRFPFTQKVENRYKNCQSAWHSGCNDV